MNAEQNADSPLVPHCELCGVALPWENVINPSYPLYPCPNCRRRVDYTTGKVVPLIDFLAAGRCYGACADARVWTAADCLHLMTMVPEPGEELRANVLLALSRSPYYRALITFATLHAHRELRAVSMDDAVSAGCGETLGMLYELLREAALHLYHRTRNSTFVGFVGWLATETGVAVTELAGQLPELMTDEDVRAPKELREVEEMSIYGKTICITGDLDAPREDYAARIRAAGGTCVGGVSRSTDYLVVGPNHGLSKIDKARKYGVKVVQPEALYAALAKAKPVAEEEGETKMKIWGKAICITGVLDAPPSVYAERIRQAGGVCVPGVSGSTHYLVVGTNPEPRKIANAQRCRVKMVTPEMLRDALEHPEPPDDGTEVVYYYGPN